MNLVPHFAGLFVNGANKNPRGTGVGGEGVFNINVGGEVGHRCSYKHTLADADEMSNLTVLRE